LEVLVAEKLLDYFQSRQWRDLLDLLARRSDVLHAHVYTASILHPHDVASVIEAFFAKRGEALKRQIRFLSHGHGVTNIYNIQPSPDSAHFEVFMTFNENAVLEADNNRPGAALEAWDTSFMHTYYDRFQFHTPSVEEEEAIRTYFLSEHWQQAYDFMMETGSLHCHVPVRMSIHPDRVIAIGREVMAEKGWVVGRAVSIVYRWRGLDQGKIVFLLARPEIVLELEWDFDSDALLAPRRPGLTHLLSEDQFRTDVAGIPYFALSNTIKQQVLERI